MTVLSGGQGPLVIEQRGARNRVIIVRTKTGGVRPFNRLPGQRSRLVPGASGPPAPANPTTGLLYPALRR